MRRSSSAVAVALRPLPVDDELGAEACGAGAGSLAETGCVDSVDAACGAGSVFSAVPVESPLGCEDASVCGWRRRLGCLLLIRGLMFATASSCGLLSFAAPQPPSAQPPSCFIQPVDFLNESPQRPAAGDGISESTLSVEISKHGSSRSRGPTMLQPLVMVPPNGLDHLRIKLCCNCSNIKLRNSPSPKMSSSKSLG